MLNKERPHLRFLNAHVDFVCLCHVRTMSFPLSPLMGEKDSLMDCPFIIKTYIIILFRQFQCDYELVGCLKRFLG